FLTRSPSAEIRKRLFEKSTFVAATLVVARGSGSFSGRDKPCGYINSRLFKQTLKQTSLIEIGIMSNDDKIFNAGIIPDFFVGGSVHIEKIHMI
ncbi:MAG TPA: hypothetical protein VJL83_05890, partial [Patescibacteria group bacterium]|nr:hypothetical protein [Patescibacteria group bacterium]